MKKTFALIAALLICAGLFAQVSVDPKDKFYTDAQNWNIRGVVDNLPPLRPYTLNNIKNILGQVIENGSENDIAAAEIYMEEIFGKSWKVELDSVAQGKVSKSGDEKSDFKKGVFFYPQVNGDMFLGSDLLSMGYELGFSARTADDLSFLPQYVNPIHNCLYDCTTVGPFTCNMEGNNIISFGKNNFYGQLGINQSGYGDFLNAGLALNDTAYHMGNFSFTYIADKWNYVQQLSMLGATPNNYQLSHNLYLYPEKYLAFHAVEFTLFDRLSFSYYESMVFGDRTDLIYVIPTPYILSQVITGCYDNLYMGVKGNLRLLDCLQLSGDLYVDDLSISDLAKFNFDCRYLIASKLGAVYTPDFKILNRVSLDFTAVLPYMYTHGEADNGSVNYQNYTNDGIAIGSSYEPNSAAVTLDVVLEPVKRMRLTFGGNFIAHGNVCESLSDDEAIKYLNASEGAYRTDGTIYNYGQLYGGSFLGGYAETYNKFVWLTQEHLMYTVQGKISCEYELQRYNWGKVSFEINSLSEYIHNKGVSSNLYNGGHSSADEQTVADAKADWVANLHNEFNQYISIGLKYNF